MGEADGSCSFLNLGKEWLLHLKFERCTFQWNWACQLIIQLQINVRFNDMLTKIRVNEAIIFILTSTYDSSNINFLPCSFSKDSATWNTPFMVYCRITGKTSTTESYLYITSMARYSKYSCHTFNLHINEHRTMAKSVRTLKWADFTIFSSKKWTELIQTSSPSRKIKQLQVNLKMCYSIDWYLRIIVICF